MKYRAEIDGLRGLSIVAVIFFHAGFEFFSGGFVGVDVFFVISGYLITIILIEDIEKKRFSIVDFYERRARRILPALYFVLLASLIISVLIMSPQQLKDFGQSLVVVPIFLSNLFFLLKADYWAQSSEFIPLLHTWSLAVEEQYYIFFPIFLALAWRFGNKRVFWVIAMMIAVSFLISEWGCRNRPSANFYLAPARAWELFAGSLAALITKKQGVKQNNFLASLGLAAIIFSIFVYDESTPFPSVYALLPVLGVVLLVLYAEKKTIAARMLSTKAIVGIGLISYSAYLWHQPFLAFYRVLQDEIEIKLYDSILITVLVLFTAFLSFKYIERPFRDKNKYSSKTVLYFSIVPLIGFIVAGLYLHKSEGLKELKMSRVPSQTAEHLNLIDLEKNKRAELWANLLVDAEAPFSNLAKTKTLFIGDSVSEDLYVVSVNSKKIQSVIESRRLPFDDECAKHISTGGLEVNHNNKLCKYSIYEYLESDLFRRADVIVIAAAWNSNSQYLSGLLEHPLLLDKRVVLYQTHAFLDISSIIYSLRDSYDDLDKMQRFIFNNKRSRTIFANQVIEDIGRAKNIPFINSFNAFCDTSQKKCKLFNIEKQPYIVDQSHLSVTGVVFFEKWLSAALVKVLNSSERLAGDAATIKSQAITSESCCKNEHKGLFYITF